MHGSASRSPGASPAEILFAGHHDGGSGIASHRPGDRPALTTPVRRRREARSLRRGAQSGATRRDPRVLRNAARGLGRARRRLEDADLGQRVGQALLGRGEVAALGKRRRDACRAGCCTPTDFDPRRGRVPDGRRRPRRPLGRRRRGVAFPLDGDAARRRATSSSCRIRAAASASARPSPRATSRTSAAATSRDILAGVDAVLAGRAGRSANASASRAGATAATWRCGPSRRPTGSPRPSRAPASRAGRATTARTRSTPGCSPSSAPPSTTTRRSTRSPRRSSSSRTRRRPTLVLHGERDSEVPTPQGYEFWHALKALGVPTRLVIYTDEGHSIRKPENQRDIVDAERRPGSTST